MPTTTSSYPEELDTFASITAGPSGTRMNDATEPASAIITHLQAAVAAIQAVLGTDDGAVADSVLRRLLLLSDADVPAAVSTITATTKTLALTDRGLLQNWTTDGAKSLTVTTDVGADGGEYHIRNGATSGDLEIVASGVTIYAPKGGTLFLEPGDAATLKRLTTNVLFLMGSTKAA